MYIHIHIYMYTYVCSHIYVYIRIYIHARICIHNQHIPLFKTYFNDVYEYLYTPYFSLPWAVFASWLVYICMDMYTPYFAHMF